MSAPTPEHASLVESAGTWSVECTYFWDPSGEPTQLVARETVELVGDLWSVSRFSCELMGQPFEGRATLGFEPTTGMWVSTWIDSMVPFLFRFEGGYDEAGTTRSMHGKGPVPGTGSPELVDYRTTEERLDPDRRRFEMFISMPDGNEAKVLSYLYTRER